MTEAEEWLMKELGYLPSDNWDLHLGSITEQFTAREQFIQKFGFAIITASVVQALKKYSPILEVGAGTGYWAHELSKAGVDIVATDPRKFIYSDVWQKHLFFEVSNMTGEDAVKKYPERNLLLVWPTYSSSWAASALRAFTGEKLIYVGEGYGGCTADDDFHECLGQKFELVEEIPMSQFCGIHDRLEVFQRKPNEIQKSSSQLEVSHVQR